MRINLYDAEQSWNVGDLVPVPSDGDLYNPEDFGEDGLTSFDLAGWTLDFNEEFNSGLQYDEIVNRTVDDLRLLPDVLRPRITVRGEGDFTVRGTSYSDIIVLGGGNDTVFDGGPGDQIDEIYGGAGNDVYRVDNVATIVSESFYDANDEFVEEGVDAGGVDRVVASVGFSLSAFIEELELTGDAIAGAGNDGDNRLIGNGRGNQLFGLGGDDVIDGGKGEDSIDGGGGDDLVRGGFQNDAVAGGSGDDQLYGDIATIGANSRGANDRLNGGEGDDAVHGDAETILAGGAGGRDTLDGGSGDDTLYGDARVMADGSRGGDDLLRGGGGDDTLYGDGAGSGAGVRGGADRLDGGAGDDTLYGGGGADRFLFGSGGFGDDVIADFAEGDRIDLRGLSVDFADLEITITAEGTLVRSAGFGSESSILLAGVTDISQSGFIF